MFNSSDPSRKQSPSTTAQKVEEKRSTPEQRVSSANKKRSPRENGGPVKEKSNASANGSVGKPAKDESSAPDNGGRPSNDVNTTNSVRQKEINAAKPERNNEHASDKGISKPEAEDRKETETVSNGAVVNGRNSSTITNDARSTEVSTNNVTFSDDKRNSKESENKNQNGDTRVDKDGTVKDKDSISATSAKETEQTKTSSASGTDSNNPLMKAAKQTAQDLLEDNTKSVNADANENNKSNAAEKESDTSVVKDPKVADSETEKPDAEPTPAEKYKRLRNLTTDEALARLKWCIDELKLLEEYHKGTTKEIMMLISGIYFDYKNIRPELGNVLVKEGFVELTVKIHREFSRLGIFSTDQIWFPTYYIKNCWWNYSDASDAVAEALAENGVVAILTLNVSHPPYLEQYTKSKNVHYVIKSSISILHNIARAGTMKHHFDESKTSEALVPFLGEDVDEMLKILANLTIAHIQDDDKNKKQILGPETIDCIVRWATDALNSEKKRCRGFCPYELVDGLNKLAVNDDNKMTMVEKGALPVLLKMLTIDDVTDQASASRMIWTLSFDKNVREKIKEYSELMEILEVLKSSKESRVKKNASGALWVIKGGNDITDEKRPQTTTTRGHIMLSYSWSDKDMVLKIKEQLQAAGFEVWIDIEKMGGSTLEAMAEAIEQASVVLLCMSEKYKNSPNCRTEAEYTFQLRKVYVPLMMQKKYKPDGWLGIILGVKLFFDFSGKYPFEKPCNGLLKELHNKTRGPPSDNAQTRVPHDDTDGALVASSTPKSFSQPGRRQSTLTSIKSSVLSMGQPEVSTWLRNEAKLTTCLTQFQKFKIDGKLLTQLVVMRTEAPEFFYQCLERRLNMDLTEILQFTSALDELVG